MRRNRFYFAARSSLTNSRIILKPDGLQYWPFSSAGFVRLIPSHWTRTESRRGSTMLVEQKSSQLHFPPFPSRNCSMMVATSRGVRCTLRMWCPCRRPRLYLLTPNSAPDQSRNRPSRFKFPITRLIGSWPDRDDSWLRQEQHKSKNSTDLYFVSMNQRGEAIDRRWSAPF
jgi:hypothetical protein